MFVKFKNATSEITKNTDLILSTEEIKAIAQSSSKNSYRVFTKSFGEFLIEGVTDQGLKDLKCAEISIQGIKEEENSFTKKMIKKYS